MSDFKPPKPPAGCKSIADWELEMTTLHDELVERGRALLAKEHRIELATAKELMLAALRAARLAGECAAQREDDARTNWRVREMHELQGRGQLQPRPPLRRKS